ncbi:MAG: LysM peptidoglycan-binding domain-containing protein [Rhodothermales bacterium]
MKRLVQQTLATTLVLLLAFGHASAQDTDTGLLPELAAFTLPHLGTAPSLPAQAVPFYQPPRVFLDQPDLAPLDSLDEKSRLRRMGNLYRYQGELLDAQAREDHEVVEALFDRIMTEIAVIARAPDALDDPRFKELYRSVVTEYESYYGFPDTLYIQQGDIFAWRETAFEALNENDLPPLASIDLPEIDIASTEISMQINEQVRNSMVFLLTEPERHINHWLSRAETYFPMVEKILEEEGVPDELKYLAMIESGLNPRARSWARAVGMWQFVKATGYAYDLTANGWVDERMDPEKATRAAARHLKDLHRMFGDWQLALAGYNFSPGKLRRYLRQAEAQLGHPATFWDVYHRLPRETRNYVPMFIATALLASNPEAYGLEQGVEPGPSYQYDLVPVQGALSLEEIADMAGTDVPTLKALNPELLGQTLPPSQSPYFIRLPLHSYDRFAEGYRHLPVAAKRAASQHVVRQGETIGQIARRYGVNVSTLMRKNGLHSTTIRIGQTLVVPTTDYSGGLQVGDAQPMRVQYGMRASRVIMPRIVEPLDVDRLIAQTTEQAKEARMALISEVEAEAQAKQAAGEADDAAEKTPPSRIVYRVRRGDTLIGIAKQYSVTVTQLRSWNGIRSNLLQIGQRLTIYPPTSP